MNRFEQDLVRLVGGLSFEGIAGSLFNPHLIPQALLLALAVSSCSILSVSFCMLFSLAYNFYLVYVTF